MNRTTLPSTRTLPLGSFMALLALGLCGFPSPSVAQSTDVETAGRIDFDFANAPPATVEVDLAHGLLSTLSGVAQASVRGAAEALRTSGHDDPGSAVQQLAEHLQAVHDVLSLAGDVIHEVHIRVYGNVADEAQDIRNSMVDHYQDKLAAKNWNRVIQVRERNHRFVISALEHDSAVRGLFVMVSGNRELVLLNVVCDLTPDKAQQLTSHATKIALKAGLDGFIEHAMAELHKARRRPAFKASPPHNRATIDVPAETPGGFTQGGSAHSDRTTANADLPDVR